MKASSKPSRWPGTKNTKTTSNLPRNPSHLWLQADRLCSGPITRFRPDHPITRSRRSPDPSGSQIRITEQCIVHAVGEVGHAGSQCKFHDLLLREMLAQFLQLLIADGGCRARHLVGKVDCGFVFLVK